MPLLCSLLKSTPKVPTTPVKAKKVSTFQEFESNTSDAWDAGEDDDELLAMATESLNSEVVMETAHRVLRNHSQRQSQPSQKEMPEPEPQPIAEPPVAPSGDLRLVKSVSESHTPCPSGRDEGIVEPRMDWTGIRGGCVSICNRTLGQESLLGHLSCVCGTPRPSKPPCCPWDLMCFSFFLELRASFLQMKC